MKNIKFLILILTVAVVSVSCETYDDYDADRTLIVGFTVSTRNINNVTSGDEKSTTADIFASESSSTERTFNVVVVPIEDTEEYPPAASENYTFDSTITIPANERIGTMTITGINVSLTSDRSYFKLALKEDSGYLNGGDILIGLKGR